MSQNQNDTLNSILNFIITVVIITAVFAVTETIGVALGIWLWVGWAVIYSIIYAHKLNYVNEFNADNYHVPSNSTDTGVYIVLNGSVTSDTFFNYLLFAAIAIAVILVIGYVSFGKNWKKGLFWFWTPIITLPVYLYVIGVIQYYPGGSSAYVNTYYHSTCDNTKCTWYGPVTNPPF